HRKPVTTHSHATRPVHAVRPVRLRRSYGCMPPGPRHRRPPTGDNRTAWQAAGMLILRSAALFVVAAFFEIGGAWLVWQGVREHRGWLWIGGGGLAPRALRFVAPLPP